MLSNNIFKHSENLKTLAFHKMQSSFSFGANNYSPRRFEILLKNLIVSGYNFVSVDELGGEVKPKSILITFDDAYAHLYEHLPRLMERYKFRPLIFIPTNYIGKSNSWDYSHAFQSCPHMDSDKIKELSQLGVEFGSHSQSHSDMTALSDIQLQLELRMSKEVIENLIGKEVNSICYPFGRYNENVVESATLFEYKYGFTMKFPHLSDSSLTIGRYPIYGFDTLLNINQKITKNFFYHCERMKSSVISKLSGGTILLQKFRK